MWVWPCGGLVRHKGVARKRPMHFSCMLRQQFSVPAACPDACIPCWLCLCAPRAHALLPRMPCRCSTWRPCCMRHAARWLQPPPPSAQCPRSPQLPQLLWPSTCARPRLPLGQPHPTRKQPQVTSTLQQHLQLRRRWTARTFLTHLHLPPRTQPRLCLNAPPSSPCMGCRAPSSAAPLRRVRPCRCWPRHRKRFLRRRSRSTQQSLETVWPRGLLPLQL